MKADWKERMPVKELMLMAMLPTMTLAAVGAMEPVIAEESPLVLFTAISGKPGKAEAVDVIRRSQAAGFNQWIVYPRSGLEFEYMGEEWLAFVGEFLKEAKARDGRWRWIRGDWSPGCGSAAVTSGRRGSVRSSGTFRRISSASARRSRSALSRRFVPPSGVRRRCATCAVGRFPSGGTA